MGSLEFIAILLVFVTISIWYVRNELDSAGGAKGLLALTLDPAEKVPGRRSYRMKPRLAHRAFEIRDVQGIKKHSGNISPSYRPLDDSKGRPRRAYKSTLDRRNSEH